MQNAVKCRRRRTKETRFSVPTESIAIKLDSNLCNDEDDEEVFFSQKVLGIQDTDALQRVRLGFFEQETSHVSS